MDYWLDMLNERRLTFRVKTGTSYVRIDDVRIKFWVTFKDEYARWNKKEVDALDVRELELPAWAECYRKDIMYFIKYYPEKIYNAISGMIINVE